MQVLPINSDFSNVSEFISSLFVPGIRTIELIQKAISTNSLTVSFSSEVEKILPIWLATWQKAQGDLDWNEDFSHSRIEDQQTFAFLGDYIKKNNLFLYVPQLTLVSGDSVLPPVYQLDGYQPLDLYQNNKWNYKSVSKLLEMFLFGAHFVVIHHPDDLQYLPQNAHVTNFYDEFQKGILAPQVRKDPGHSHYTSMLNLCGYYFPSVHSDDTPPDPVPFNLAWLVGLTKSNVLCEPSSANTFFQLEGWQAQFKGLLDPSHNRHLIDNEIYKKTLWNISTYGACVYSEKRGTALFLAPSNWDPKSNSETFMQPYVGAKTRQSWLNTNVITLP